MKTSTAKRRINKVLDELTQTWVDSFYAQFKDGYIKGYADARQGISPMYAEAHDTADTPQTDCDDCIWNVCNYNKVEWDADTTQTEPMKTADYCDICKRDICEGCIADATNPYCVPSHYEINYEPKDEPKTQMKTENSNLTFEKRTMLDCYNCKRYKSDDACVECRYEPKTDTPQTELPKQIRTPYEGDIKVTPQTESTGSPIGDYRDGVGAWQTDCGWK